MKIKRGIQAARRRANGEYLMDSGAREEKTGIYCTSTKGRSGWRQPSLHPLCKNIQKGSFKRDNVVLNSEESVVLKTTFYVLIRKFKR